jgi:hypothetical protein
MHACLFSGGELTLAIGYGAGGTVGRSPLALLLRRNDGSVASGREKTKRITVDLPRSEHTFLRDFVYEGDTDGVRVVRALLLELRDDPSLSPRVLGRMGEL